MTYFLTQSAQHLRPLLINRGASIGSYHRFAFADEEWGFRLTEDVTRKDVTLVGSVHASPDTLFDLLAMFRLLRENKAKNINLTIPYLGYARQDKNEPGEAAIGVMVAELIRNLNPSNIHVLDPHSPTILEALGPNAQTFDALAQFAEVFMEKTHPVDVVVAPDQGAKERAQRFADFFDATPDVAWIDKKRPEPNVAIAHELHGDVTGKHAVIVDDIIDTGGTIREAVNKLVDHEVASVRVVATHGVFSKGARSMMEHLQLKEVFTTNSLPQERADHINVLDVSPLILDLP